VIGDPFLNPLLNPFQNGREMSRKCHGIYWSKYQNQDSNKQLRIYSMQDLIMKIHDDKKPHFLRSITRKFAGPKGPNKDNRQTIISS